MHWSQLRWRRPGKAQLLGLAGTLLTGVLLCQAHDFAAAGRVTGGLPTAVIVGAFAAMTGGLLVSSIRHRAVMEALGLRLPFWLAFRANVLGLLGGLLFLQVIGQTLARTAVLARHGVGGATVVFANFCERAVAMLSLLGLGLCAGIYLYGGISFDTSGGGAPLVKTGIGIGLAVVAVLVAVPDLRSRVFAIRARPAAWAVLGLLGHSLLVHGATLMAFVLLAQAMAPEVPLGQVAAASLLVMIAASLPISFAGWGVRELSAVHAFSLIGIGADKALAIAIVVGLGSLAAVLMLGLVASLMSGRTAAPAVVEGDVTTLREGSDALSLQLAVWVPAMVALLVLFQIHVPTLAGSVVNVNLADPVAVLGGVLFVALFRQRGGSVSLWRTQQLPACLAAVTVVIGLGFGIGLWRYGFIDWAFYNRLLGWFILLGYLATGALSFVVLGRAGRARMLSVLLASGLVIAGLEIGLTGLSLGGYAVGHLLPLGGIMGLSQNSNAFALQMLMLLALVLVLNSWAWDDATSASVFGRSLVLAVILVALFLSRSRAGYVAGSVLIASAVVLRWAPWRVVVGAGAMASALLAGFWWLGTSVRRSLPWVRPLFRVRCRHTSICRD